MKYVYLLRAGEGLYKVGVATNLTKRVTTMQTSNGHRIQIVTAKLVKDAYKFEQEMHSRLVEMRVDGGNEWFSLTPDQALNICMAIHENPELPIVDAVTVGVLLTEQAQRQKSIERKLDAVIAFKQIQREERQRQRDEMATLIRPVTKPITSLDTYAEQALQIFKDEGRASTSLLQRKMSLGYGKAARIIDYMVARGLVERDGNQIIRFNDPVATQ